MNARDDANILARIRGEDVARALHSLPPCDSVPVSTVEFETTIDIPELGRVRFTCKRLKHRKGRMVRYFWTAERATIV